MNDTPIQGSVHPPQRTDDAAVLTAFRKVTEWDDWEVLHWTGCAECHPWPDDYENHCAEYRRLDRLHPEEPQPPASRPDQPQGLLSAALRREAERIAGRVRAFAPLHHGAVRASVIPETLARIREQLGDSSEIRLATGGVILTPFRRADGVIHGTAGGPYCRVCGAPVDAVPTPAYPGDQTTAPGSCPNGCDPRDAGQSR